MAENSRAQQAKEQGSQAWKEGNYRKAVECFTEAISISNDNRAANKEFLKVLYSNRSAAHMKLHKAEEALKDANECVALDSNWAKGLARKGDALFVLKRYVEAYNAYNSALRLDQTNVEYQRNAEKAMNAIRNDSDSSSSSSSSTSNDTTSSGKLMRYARLAILILGVVYAIPNFRIINFYAYKIAAALYANVNLVEIVKKCGYPKFTTEYGLQLMSDSHAMRVFLGSFLVFSNRQYFFALLPALLTELTNFTPEIFEYVRANSSQVEAQILPLLARINPDFARIRLDAIFANQHISKANAMFHRMAATSEVSQGIFHILELFFPTRNLMMSYLWWQYLKMRYMTDKTNNIKLAFKEVDDNILMLVNHQYCPQIVRQGYSFVKNYLAKQVEIPSRNAAGAGAGGMGSMLSKCTIM